MSVKYIAKLDKTSQLSEEEKEKLRPVADKFAYRTNDYYNKLINWDDPDDPIRRLVIPSTEELSDWGELDASSETLYQPVPGLEHKYQSTALLLCNDVCGAYCRFCFRKRLFQDDNDEVVRDVSQGVNYILEHKEVTNVLLTGGDPLVMSTRKLRIIFEQLYEVPHLKIIRIGTKMTAFNPFRILDDPDLFELIKDAAAHGKQVYIMAHFNHPRELTAEARKALAMLKESGAAIVNQSPIIRGVNDKVEVLRELFDELSYMGIQPYYAFGCRPTEGNESFAVPVEEAYQLVEEAKRYSSGLAKTARFAMSHKYGKFEVVGLTDDLIVMKNHNVRDKEKNGQLIISKRNPNAYWFDDYEDSTIEQEALSALI